MEEGGNDYSLGKAVKEMGGYTYHVKDYVDTHLRLIELTEPSIVA